ncbi:hypothetical protein [Halorussus marinus]|uniref:hypothetical protein n=1 Tax=Halorussus marinus TaxID=2505976 RepID=UPI001092800A|nr:hypothetical protein [Halorussus marinus]
MNPRDIIRRDHDSRDGEGPLRVLVDTASLNEQLADGNDAAQRVLDYAANREFEFIRSPDTPRHEELECIPPYTIETAENGARVVRSDDDGEQTTTSFSHLFGYQERAIRRTTARVFSDDVDAYATEVEDVTDRELATVRQVFVHAALNHRDEGHLFITNRAVLLTNRRWFEAHFPGGQLNIMSLSEAVEYLGLYLRYREQFYASPNLTVGMFGWYWHLFRSLVPRYHVEADANDDYLRGFSIRFQNLLIAVDEIGYQYFQEPDNRTQLNVQYHFDNAISLITGVFDTLALKTAEKYAIDDIRKEFISLSNNRGRDFLDEVREANTDLRDHIAAHMAYINLLYVLRPLVVHRGGYQDSLLEDANQGWTAGVIPLDRFNEADRDAFERYYPEIDDDPLPYDPLTEWGLYQADWADAGYIEPYHFMKAAVKTLIQFANAYLQLLGYPDFIEQHREDDQGATFIDTCDRIRQTGLTGFYQVFP